MNTSKYIYLNKKNGQRTGVLAVEPLEQNKFRLAFSLCGGQDAFEPKTGVARALGRLKSQKQSKIIDASGSFYIETELLALMKTAPFRTNPYNHVDWETAQKKFVSTFINKKPKTVDVTEYKLNLFPTK